MLVITRLGSSVLGPGCVNGTAILQGLLLCTPTGVLQWGNADVDTVVRLADKVGETRVPAPNPLNVGDMAPVSKNVEDTQKMVI